MPFRRFSIAISAPLLDQHHYLKFIPKRSLRLFSESSEILTNLPCSRTFVNAAALFIDISGFTALSEHFAQFGSKGTENFAKALNGYFKRLLKVVAAFGGDVDCFAGDALLVIFLPRGPISAGIAEDGVRIELVERALLCAKQMIDESSPYTVDESHSLTLHCAVGVGEARSIVVGGGVSNYAATMMDGEILHQLALALPHAGSGECVVSGSAWSLVKDRGFTGQLRGDDCVLLTAVGVSLALASVTDLAEFEKEKASEEQGMQSLSILASQAEKFTPHFVRERVVAGLFDYMGEHRVVSVGFMRFFDGFDLGSPSGLALFHSVACLAFEIVQEHGGICRQLTQDEKGIIFIYGFGLGGSQDDRATSSIRVGLALHAQQLEKLKVRVAVGLATGRIFCGLIGDPQKRCEYTLLGFTVNLAARLCFKSTAETPVIMCDRTQSEASIDEGLSFVNLPPIKLKGKAEEQVIFTVRARSGIWTPTPSSTPPVQWNYDLIQRPATDVTDQCVSALGAFRRQDRGTGIILLRGEAGVGKTIVMRSIFEKQRIGLPFSTKVSSLSSNMFFGALTPMIRMLIEKITTFKEMSRSTILNGFVKHLDEETAEHVALLKTILPDVFGAFNESGITASLEGAAKLEFTQRLLSEFFKFGASVLSGSSERMARFLLVFDDAHNLDSQTWEFIVKYVQKESDVQFLLVYRSSEGKLFEEMQTKENVFAVELGALAVNEMKDLLLSQFKIRHIPDELVTFVHSKSVGNPLFGKAVCAELLKSGLLTVKDGVLASGKDGETLETILRSLSEVGLASLPDKIESVMVMLLDNIGPNLSFLAKVVSVLDLQCDLDSLVAVYPVPREREDLETDLHRLIDLRILGVQKSSFSNSGSAFIFQNSLIKEAAYNTLLHAHRTKIHWATVALLHQELETSLDNRSLFLHHWRKILSEEDSSFGLDHNLGFPEIVEVLLRCGRMERDIGNPREAVRVFETAVATARKIIHEDTPASGPNMFLLESLNELSASHYLALDICSSTVTAIRLEAKNLLLKLEGYQSQTEESIVLRRKMILTYLRGEISSLADKGAWTDAEQLLEFVVKMSNGDEYVLLETEATRIFMNTFRRIEPDETISASVEALIRYEKLGRPELSGGDVHLTMIKNQALNYFEVADFRKFALSTQTMIETGVEALAESRSQKLKLMFVFSHFVMTLVPMDGFKICKTYFEDRSFPLDYNVARFSPLLVRFNRFLTFVTTLIGTGCGKEFSTIRIENGRADEFLSSTSNIRPYHCGLVRVALKFGRLENAKDLLEGWASKHSPLAPARVDYYRLFAIYLFATGALAEAEKQFLLALDNAKQIGWVFLGLCSRWSYAQMLNSMNRREEALNQLSKILEWGRDNREQIVQLWPVYEEVEELFSVLNGWQI